MMLYILEITIISQLQLLPKDWTKEDLCVWISEILQFPEYITYLKKKKINGSKFIRILDSKEKLKKIEIFKLGHIKLMKLLLSKMGVEFIIENRKLSLDSINMKSPRKSSQERIEKLLLSPRYTTSLPNKLDISIKKKKYRNIGIKKILKWDKDDIALWLDSIDLYLYNEIFIENSIRGDILFDLEEKHLREMGIIAYGHIKKILRSIQKLDPTQSKSKKNSKEEIKEEANLPKVLSPRKDIRQWNVIEVTEWLKYIGLGSYSSNFFQERIDGQVLMQINKNDLEDLGITSIGIQKKILNEIENQKKN